jgi:hypothetical protein
MGIKNTRFRTHNNIRYTKQLFWDMHRMMANADKAIDPIYTLHDDVEGLINFRKEYVRDMDPTGYKTANRLLESYDHWNLLMRGQWFRDAKAEWDKEIAAILEKEATDVLRGIALDSDLKPAERTSAAKAILGRAKSIRTPEKTTVGPGRGRPSNEEVQGELKRQAALTKDELDDLKRIQGVG